MLLGWTNVNPNTMNQQGETPLFVAARKGREKVVKALLERVDVNPNTADICGKTPLYIAAKEGHE